MQQAQRQNFGALIILSYHAGMNPVNREKLVP